MKKILLLINLFLLTLCGCVNLYGAESESYDNFFYLIAEWSDTSSTYRLCVSKYFTINDLKDTICKNYIEEEYPSLVMSYEIEGDVGKLLPLVYQDNLKTLKHKKISRTSKVYFSVTTRSPYNLPFLKDPTSKILDKSWHTDNNNEMQEYLLIYGVFPYIEKPTIVHCVHINALLQMIAEHRIAKRQKKIDAETLLTVLQYEGINAIKKYLDSCQNDDDILKIYLSVVENIEKYLQHKMLLLVQGYCRRNSFNLPFDLVLIPANFLYSSTYRDYLIRQLKVAKPRMNHLGAV